MARIRFDDIDGIRRFVGGEFGPWGPEVEVTQQRVDDFAAISGDHQWIHVDVERCRRESPFAGPIAQGLLVLSMMTRLEMPLPCEIIDFRHMLHVGSDRLRFVRPVPVGVKIHGRARLDSVERVDKGTRTVAELDIHRVGDDTPSVVYRIITLYQ